MATPIRPDFDDSEEPSPAAARTSPLLAWLRLTRLPNVFTAVADVAMGYLVVHRSFAAPPKLACLVAASACLYTAGMVLNDVFDFAEDAKERPVRPLPSGQISLLAARALGYTLLVLGIAFGWLAGFADATQIAIPWRSGAVATALAGCVLLYNLWLKRTPLGPIGMGLCRFLNVLLGMSAARALIGEPVVAGYSSGELLAAGGIGIYIVGVTIFAKREAAESISVVLNLGLVVMAAGVAVLAMSMTYLAPPRMAENIHLVWILLGLLMLPVLRRALAAAFNPTPDRVQAAVKHSILSLIWLDAATAAAVAHPAYAVAVAALLAPALLLGRWVYST